MPKRSRTVRRPRRQQHVANVPRDANAYLPFQQARTIPLNAIWWSSIVRTTNAEHVQRLADAVRLPPVVVWEFEKGKFRGVDGYHRWLAAKNRGDVAIRAIVRDYSGTDSEKQFDFECVQMNLQHGLPLTRWERDSAIRRLWSRWGFSPTRPHGVTLEELGKFFNLTKQRIHQIVTSAAGGPVDRLTEAALVRNNRTIVQSSQPHGAGFSPLGRFSAAANRLSTVLNDPLLIRQLLREHQREVHTTVERLRVLLDQVLNLSGASSPGPIS